MASVVKSVMNTIREKGFSGFLRTLKEEGYLRCLPDGNLLQTKIHNIGARLVGVDKFGNKYYERLEDTQYATVRLLPCDLEVLHLLREGGDSNHPDFNLIAEAREMLHRDWEVEFCHAPRNANKAADLLAQQALRTMRGVNYMDHTMRRHRWVEYAEKTRYNASQVPPEWHGWLHFITDHTGDELLLLKPKRYSVEHKENLSGEGEQYIYHSKGHALNPGQRDWTRYQSWQSKA